MRYLVRYFRSFELRITKPQPASLTPTCTRTALQFLRETGTLLATTHTRFRLVWSALIYRSRCRWRFIASADGNRLYSVITTCMGLRGSDLILGSKRSPRDGQRGFGQVLIV